MNRSIKKPMFVSGTHNFLLAASIVGVIYFLQGVISILSDKYDIQILEINPVCEQPLNNRCVNLYTVQHSDGSQDKIQLSGYLFRDSELVVGNKIDKPRFSFVYQVNGCDVSWGFAGHYLTVIIFSILTFASWRYETPDA